MVYGRAERLALACVLALLAGPGGALAADAARSRQVVTLVYDIGLYNAELDRAIQQAEGRGVFGVPTPALRTLDRDRTRAAMLGQRDAVLRAASEFVADRASDLELRDLLRVANGEPPVDQALVDSAVAVVKASFNDALWHQMSTVARGNAEFRCVKGTSCR